MNEVSPWRRRLAQNEEFQPEFSRGAEPEEVPLSHYWNILLKRRHVILPIFFVVFAAGAYFALSATTLYTATTTIKIEPQNPRVTGGLGEFQPESRNDDYDYHQTQFVLLRSRPLAARVITELGLDARKSFTHANIVSPNPVDHVRSWIFRTLGLLSSYAAALFKSARKTEEFDPIQQTAVSGKVDPEVSVSPRLIDQYLGFIGVVPIQKTRLVNVNFTTPDPALSQALANAHAQAFMRMSLESRFSLTQEAREFLDKKKHELQQKLERSEGELNKFRRAHGVVSVEKGENIVVDRLVDLNRQLTTARAQRIEAESLFRTVENRNHQDLAEIMRQGLVQQLKGNLASLEAEKARESSIFKADHPRIQDLNQQIAAARQALSNEVAIVVRGIRSNYAAALAKETALDGETDKQQRDALKLKEVGVQYTVLQEEVNAHRSLFESVLKRLSETNVSNDLAVSNMQIVARAAKPSRASGPNAPLYLLGSLISGLFLGVGVAFLREFFDSTVGTPDEVWRSVGLGTLGVVPHLKFLDRPVYGRRQIDGPKQAATPLVSRAPAKELITNHGPLSIMYEAYRAIRTSLLLCQAEKPPQVILLTSPSAGEGKTVTSLNLAVALVRDGHTVLLVDADMRKGCCHNRLGLTNSRGLSNVLAGGLSLDEGIQDTPVRGLSLFSRGIPPPNPTELLGSPRMKDILNELRQRFEFILIDSPPVVAISDAVVLSAITDGVLLVFDGHTTSTASAQKAVERLDMVRARLLGVILNGVNLDNPDYSYYRTYSQYYQGSNEHAEHHAPSAEKSDEGVTPSHNRVETNNGLGVESYKNHPNNQANGESATRIPQNDCLKPVETGNLRKTDEESALRLTRASRTTSTGMAAVHGGQAEHTVSQAFLDRLIHIFTESVGPLAPLIVRDQIFALGESQNAFPRSRIYELLRSIEPEILNPQIRLGFQAKIATEIRNLDKQ